MEYWLWGLYAAMTVFCLRSLFVLMQRHRMTHQYKVVLEVQKEMKRNAEGDEQEAEITSEQKAA